MEPLEPELVDRAAAFLGRETGMTFTSARRSTLERALSHVMADGSITATDDLASLLDRDTALYARLVSLVRIGETYFFRHPEQLDVLARRVLGPLIARRAQAGSSVSIWSAGCSTGEEAYTLAILAQEIAARHPGAVIRLAGTDIDETSLQVAREGTYRHWSFRSDLGERQQWFLADGDGSRIHPDIAAMVTFSIDNLATADAGAPPGLPGPPDVIVCRNVTMYLSDEVRRRAAERFWRVLAPGGWLTLAPVELSSSVYSTFEAVREEGQTFYRRTEHARAAQVAGDAAGQPPIRDDGSGGVRRRGHRLPAHRLPAHRPPVHGRATHGRASTRPATRSAVAGRDDPLTAARSLADEGRLPEARAAAEQAARAQPGNRDAYLLLASIAEGQDDLAAAVTVLRRALYLERADPVVQLRLGLLEWRLGRMPQARSRIRTAVALVADMDGDRELDPQSGLTVGRLRDAAGLLGHG